MYGGWRGWNTGEKIWGFLRASPWKSVKEDEDFGNDVLGMGHNKIRGRKLFITKDEEGAKKKMDYREVDEMASLCHRVSIEKPILAEEATVRGKTKVERMDKLGFNGEIHEQVDYGNNGAGDGAPSIAAIGDLSETQEVEEGIVEGGLVVSACVSVKDDVRGGKDKGKRWKRRPREYYTSHQDEQYHAVGQFKCDSR